MGKIKIGAKEKEIIKIIGTGALIFVAAGSPKFSRELLKLFAQYSHQQISDFIHNLKEKNIIYLSGERVKLTPKGIKLLTDFRLIDTVIVQSEHWDGLWRIVSYDVPEMYKKSRNIFRAVLENNGFVQLHKSLWVTPYDCKEELAIFAKNLGVNNDVIFMTTDHLPNQERYLKLFDLKQK